MGGIRVLGAGYRIWAKEIFYRLRDLVPYVVDTRPALKLAIKDFSPEVILFYGWSWIVPNWVLNSATCLCLHPSPLPKYRGGSPFQHQIINGESKSAVSIFRMTDELDAGPLVAQVEFPLDGTLEQILSRVTDIGEQETRRLLTQSSCGWWKQEGKPTYFKRRTPEESEITLTELSSSTAKMIYDKVRSLAHPDYPPAFITCGDGKRIQILKVRVDESEKL